MWPLQSKIILNHKSEAQTYLQSLWSYLSMWPLMALRLILDKEEIASLPDCKFIIKNCLFFFQTSQLSCVLWGGCSDTWYNLCFPIHPSIHFLSISRYTCKRSNFESSVTNTWVCKWVLTAGLHLQIGFSN